MDEHNTIIVVGLSTLQYGCNYGLLHHVGMLHHVITSHSSSTRGWNCHRLAEVTHAQFLRRHLLNELKHTISSRSIKIQHVVLMVLIFVELVTYNKLKSTSTFNQTI